MALISPLVRDETEEKRERQTGVPSTQYVTGLSGVIIPELRPGGWNEIRHMSIMCRLSAGV